MDRLFYGDNLEVLRQRIPDESVDLVYLDPPFNSNRNYNVIFSRHATHPNDATAQIQAFGDTWVWTPATEQQYSDYVAGGLPSPVSDALTAFRTLLGENDAMAYLVNMAPRLVELHRTLRPTGSLYLHCDPTMSHYLKVLLDAVFGPVGFRNEIIWQRTNSRTVRGQWPRVHDVILYYGKSDMSLFAPLQIPASQAKLPHTLIAGPEGKKYQTYELTAAEVRNPESEAGREWRGFDPAKLGRHWANTPKTMDEWDAEGLIHWPKNGGWPRRRAAEPFDPGTRTVQVGDLWTDVDRINQSAKERLGYPTQKPVALMERILAASSAEGDVVLDPFCGCGTTIDAAIRLERRWIGIDVTYLAVDLIEKRLEHTFGADIKNTYEVLGIPRDKAAALALFSKSPFDFERWAVSLVGGQPNQKQVGDKGIDGVARFPLGRANFGRVLISVKGGKQLNPSMVRDLGGTVTTQKAEMGVLITNGPPTPGMVDEANHAGVYQHPNYPQGFPRIQIITVDELLGGKRPQMPPTVLPYIQAQRKQISEHQVALFEA